MTDKGFTNVGLDYNTEREKLIMPEYGRNVLKMVEALKTIEDRQMRTRQARAVVKVMEWQRGRNNPAKTYIAIAKYCGGKVRIKGYYPCSETGAMEAQELLDDISDKRRHRWAGENQHLPVVERFKNRPSRVTNENEWRC